MGLRGQRPSPRAWLGSWRCGPSWPRRARVLRWLKSAKRLGSMPRSQRYGPSWPISALFADWNPGVRESHQTSNGSAVKVATRCCKPGGKNYLKEEEVLFENAGRHYVSHNRNESTLRRGRNTLQSARCRRVDFADCFAHLQTEVRYSGCLDGFSFCAAHISQGYEGLAEGTKATCRGGRFLNSQVSKMRQARPKRRQAAPGRLRVSDKSPRENDAC